MSFSVLVWNSFVVTDSTTRLQYEVSILNRHCSLELRRKQVHIVGNVHTYLFIGIVSADLVPDV
jgi:hypothetical protein